MRSDTYHAHVQMCLCLNKHRHDSTALVVTAGELARTTTLADLAPGLPLSDADVEELAATLPEIIKNIVENRRLDRKVEN